MNTAAPSPRPRAQRRWRAIRAAAHVCLMFVAPAGHAEDEALAAARAACESLAAATQEINVGTGVNNEQVTAATPLRLQIQTGAQPALMEDCLRREGFGSRERAAASFDRAADCRSAARRPVVLRRADNTTTLAGDYDEQDYRRCLDPQVDVEVIGTGKQASP